MSFKKIQRVNRYDDREFFGQKCPFPSSSVTRDTCRAKKFREGTIVKIESFSGRSVRFRHPQLPEIHVVQKNSESEPLLR